MRTKTQPGDRIIVCAEEELEARIAEISVPMTAASVTHFADAPGSDVSLPVAVFPKLPQHPLPGLRVSAPILTASVPQGTGFTAAMTAGWQISNRRWLRQQQRCSSRSRPDYWFKTKKRRERSQFGKLLLVRRPKARVRWSREHNWQHRRSRFQPRFRAGRRSSVGACVRNCCCRRGCGERPGGTSCRLLDLCCNGGSGC